MAKKEEVTIEDLPGVGAATAQKLRDLGLSKYEDMLHEP